MKYLGPPQSGSQNGTTASRGRAGQYYRTRSMPTQPRTESQQAVRLLMSSVSQSWRTLTQEQRSGWDSYALAHPIQDSLGQTIVLSGAQYFNKVNVLLLNAGYVLITEPPSDEAVISTPPLTVSNTTVAAMAMSLQDSDPPSAVNIFVSPPQSQGRNFNGDFRFIAGVIGDDTDPTPVPLAAALAAKFGTLQAGQKFFVRWDYGNQNGQFITGGRTSFVLT